MGLLCLTYTINSVDEGIVTAVAHSQPMATKEDYVDVSVAEKDEGKFVSVSSRTKMESLFFFWHNNLLGTRIEMDARFHRDYVCCCQK